MERHSQAMISHVLLFLSYSYFCEGVARCGPRHTCVCYSMTKDNITMDCHGYTLNISEMCQTCSGGENITVLDMSEVNDEQFLNIPAFCFRGCIKLRKLSLSANNILDFNDKSFADLTELKDLDLSKNNLIEAGKFANPRIFRYTEKLEILHLQGNANISSTARNISYLSNIPKGAFPSLNALFIDGPELVHFGQNFFFFEHLSKLDFATKYSVCNIITLTNFTFSNIPKLVYLNLAFCNLSFIDAGAFGMLHNMVYLNLSNNVGLGFVTLRNVSYGLQSTQTKILDYSKVYKAFGLSTELRRCDVWYMKNTTIKELYLDNNRMALIEVNAIHLFPPLLEVASVERNQLTFGPYVVQASCLQHLRRAEISEQCHFPIIDYYDDEVYINEKRRTDTDDCIVPKPKPEHEDCPYLDNGPFSLSRFKWPKNLKILNTRSSNIPITRLPEHHNDTPVPLGIHLESMDASQNLIKSWYTQWVYLNDLKHINLSNNFASGIEPDFFIAAPNLLSVDMSNNFLGTPLSEDTYGLIFKPLEHLEILNLSTNKIPSLPEKLFSTLNNLSILSLAFNSISQVPNSLACLSNLAELDLRQNKISTVPVQLLKQMDDTASKKSRNISIDLSSNTIAISCDNLDFLEWVVEHPNDFKDLDSYIYQYKGRIGVMSIKEVEIAVVSLQKNCKNYTAVIIISTIFIVGFAFSIMSGLVYRFRWRLRYLYYMAKARYGGYDPIPDHTLDYRYDVFVSYAHEDYRFIKYEVIEELEDKYGFTLCIHQRDFLPGNYIAENIIQAIKNSRMVVIVLTENFLKSKWCIYEYNMARMESIYSRNNENVIVCIMLEDIDTKHLSPELIETLESETYQKYPEDENERPYFWEMVKRALSHLNN